MSEAKKSFEDLVAAAPEAAAADTVSLVGTLSRTAETGKFVLNMGDGRAVTLDTAAVKHHAVLGSSVGQQIVRVDLDPKSLPAELVSANMIGNPVVGTGAAVDQPFTNPGLDHLLTLPRADDTVSYLDTLHSNFFVDVQGPFTGVADIAGGTFVEGIPDPTGGTQQAAALVPFALAAAQQVPQATLAALGARQPVIATNFHDLKHPAWDLKVLMDFGASNMGSRFPD